MSNESLAVHLRDPSHFADAIKNVPVRKPGTEDFTKQEGISHVGLFRDMFGNENVKRYFADHMPGFPPDIFEKMLSFLGIKENDIHVFFDNDNPRFIAMQQPLWPLKSFNSIEHASGLFSWEQNDKAYPPREEFAISGVHGGRVYSANYTHIQGDDGYVLSGLSYGITNATSDELPPFIDVKVLNSVAFEEHMITPMMTGKTKNRFIGTIIPGLLASTFETQERHPVIKEFLSGMPTIIPVQKN